METCNFYQQTYKLLIQSKDSPYTKHTEDGKAKDSLEEYLWAFSIVGSRTQILNN